MKQEKFNINIESLVLRCNQKGKISSAMYPKAFGDKEKNNFIKTENEDYLLKIKTPVSTSISDVFNKLEEITNVIYVELYNIKEMIWPISSFEDINLTSKINLAIDKEYYEELKKINPSLPQDLEEAYKIIKENFTNNFELFERTYGKIKIKASKSGIVISNIKNNYLTKNTLTENDVMFLITTIFGALEESTSKTISEELKRLTKISKSYGLKTTLGIQNMTEELKAKKSRLEKELSLSHEEIMKISKEYLQEGYDTRYCLQKYNKIASESIVLIKDAISQGVDYKILNEAKSVVELTKNGHKEIVIEGNKTDRDSYIFPIVTDDKFTSKQIMANAGLNVPKAILLEKEMDKEDIEFLVSPFYNKSLVVKPRNTNYGTGITVFAKKASKKQILDAIEYAFKFDNNVLIEEYVKGMEYRFLVVNGKCLSVAHRRIASVVGNGVSTIKELIDEKNKEPWHYLTATPVKMDEPVVEYLSRQGYNFETIPKEGERVFLRTNSNCSTGGESVDMTSIMPNKFKKIAEKASRAFNAKICGVDIIIDDMEKDDYAIIEINDNPGYSINEWPYEPKEGRGEKIGISILKLLDLV